MWSKREKGNVYTMNGDEPFTFLGKGAQFKGIIHFEGTIRIDGRLEGEIHTKGTLMVGEHAVIEGDISADVVVSGGHIDGNIVWISPSSRPSMRIVPSKWMIPLNCAPLPRKVNGSSPFIVYTLPFSRFDHIDVLLYPALPSPPSSSWS